MFVLCSRYYRGVVLDTSSEELYVVSFDDGSYCDNLPPTDIIVSVTCLCHASRVTKLYVWYL